MDKVILKTSDNEVLDLLFKKLMERGFVANKGIDQSKPILINLRLKKIQNTNNQDSTIPIWDAVNDFTGIYQAIKNIPETIELSYPDLLLYWGQKAVVNREIKTIDKDLIHDYKISEIKPLLKSVGSLTDDEKRNILIALFPEGNFGTMHKLHVRNYFDNQFLNDLKQYLFTFDNMRLLFKMGLDLFSFVDSGLAEEIDNIDKKSQ